MKKSKKRTSYRWFAFVLVILLVAFFISKQSQKQEQAEIDAIVGGKLTLDVQSFPSQGFDHINEPNGFVYNSNPPTSGPHFGRAPAWGFYEEALPDESLIHALEHGGMWISHRDLNEQELDEVKSFARKYPGAVLVTPRDENQSRIAVAAWTKLMELDEVDLPRFEKFLLLYKNKTHEPRAK